ncbi:sugar kinase [Actinomadura scrupuli]|uniref:sugar kinase n=1 Tax=Actinomadura scrupuli TaxID=559629 RepID=UPI003D96CE98
MGESMAALVPDQAGPLEDVATFHQSIGGAESNVACGLAALGVGAAWVGRVGADGFGRRIIRRLTAQGVDTSAVIVDPSRPTGLYVKEIGRAGSVLHYYRAGSAASALGPELLEDDTAGRMFADAGLIHLSGITAALSGGSLDLLRAIMRRRRPGQLVSFDLNWRPALWRGKDPSVLRSLLNAADIALLGADEAVQVLGTGDPQALRTLLPGPDTLVIKDDAHLATAIDRSGVTAEPPPAVEVVEPVGAGDAFAAGYLAGTLRGYDQRRRLRLGHLMAATTLVVHGDHGAPPPAHLVEALLASSPGEWAATTVSVTGVHRAGEREAE